MKNSKFSSRESSSKEQSSVSVIFDPSQLAEDGRGIGVVANGDTYYYNGIEAKKAIAYIVSQFDSSGRPKTSSVALATNLGGTRLDPKDAMQVAVLLSKLADLPIF